MKTLAFDLISDLHIIPGDVFCWEGQATSLNAIIAGDISKDQDTVISALVEISKYYQQVYFIDGNAEHRYALEDIEQSQESLAVRLQDIKNLLYLRHRVVLHDGLAIIGSNGWWSYDLDPAVDEETSFQWCRSAYNISDNALMQIYGMAVKDYFYMCHAVKEMQDKEEVSRILMVTHTVPLLELLKHDVIFDGQPMINVMGNSKMREVLDFDINDKISNWVFGHYHSRIDLAFNKIRFCNNPRGRLSDNLYDPYYPLRLEIEL